MENRGNTMKPRVQIVEHGKKSLTGYTLIEGFPGMGLVGTIAAKYIVERLEFREYGYIDSSVFIPIIRIHEGIPVYPSRIYINEGLKLLVLISEQIIPRQYTDDFAQCVVQWAKEKKISRMISLAGINSQSAKEKNEVYGIAANAESLKELQKHGIEIIKDGITTGITALILLELKKSGINAVSIMGNASFQADYKAAAAIIEKLNDLLGLKINVEPLLKEARETEKVLLKQMDEMRKTGNTLQRVEDKTPMYT
ncbi:MAG: PAC2 family protein [archaeon]